MLASFGLRLSPKLTQVMRSRLIATLLVAAHARKPPPPPSDRANLRANLCFSSFAKTELYCREAPAPGPLEVYESPANGFRTGQLSRAMYWRKGKLCDEKRRACRKMPVRVLAANADLPKPAAFGLSALCLLLPVAVLFYGSRSTPTAAARKPPATAKGAGGGGGLGQRIATGLLRFASQPWFPWVAAAGTAINMFTIVFTAATVVLFLGATLGQRKRWRSTAIANALGATAGSAVLLLLMRMQGGDGAALLERQFPTVLASPAWAKTTALMQSYGVGGMVVVASLPLILHPVIAFGVLTGLSDGAILAIVLLGRSLKYLTMGYLTAHAPAALRFFGIKASLIDLATKATADAEKE